MAAPFASTPPFAHGHHGGGGASRSTAGGAHGVRPGYEVLGDRSVRFVLERPMARHVAVAGSFTGWEQAPIAMRRRLDGRWEARTAPMAEGAYFYKYVVDGDWILDPAHPMMEDDGKGGANSAFGIGGPNLGSGDHTLRIASLNLHTWQEPDARLKIEQAAVAFAAADVHVIALQEVGEHLTDVTRSNAGDILQEHLERLTGEVWHHEWAFAHLGFRVYREGVSLLSRAPLEHLRAHEVSTGALRRVALSADPVFGGDRVRVVSLHLSWPQQGGEGEIEQLMEKLRQDAPLHAVATFLLGDVNAKPEEATSRRLRDAGWTDVAAMVGVTDKTWGVPPLSRIDYHWMRGMPGHPVPVVSAFTPMFAGNVVANTYLPRVSDHLGLLGAYRLHPQGPWSH